MTSPESGVYVDAGGVQTHYLDAGDGPTVLLLHGSGPGVSAITNWSRTFAALSARFRVIAPDLLGFGETARAVDGKYGTSVWSAHVLAFLDALGIKHANFIGNSMGGRISLDIAFRYPERVDKLVLMGVRAPGTPASDGLRAVRAYRPGKESMRQLLQKYFACDTSLVTEDLVTARYEASARPGAFENYQQMFASQASNDLPLSDDDVRAVRHDTLIAHGRDDLVIPLEDGLKLFQLLPNAELHAFGGCGHWVQIERGDRFEHLVRDFLASPSRRAGLLCAAGT